MQKTADLLAYGTVLFLVVFQCTAPEKTDKQPLFTKLTAEETGISFSNVNTETPARNIFTYEYFYNGGGVALGDINNDSLVDIYFSANQGPGKLYLNKGNFQFEDITSKAGVAAASGWKTGVSMVDFNADGLLDIYVCKSAEDHPLFRVNLLFINNGDLTFTDKAAAYGLNDDSYTTQASFFDYDKDGDLDALLLNHSRLVISNSYDISTRYKDRVRYVGNRFFRNDGGKMTDISDSAGIHGPASNYGLGVAGGDLNNDDWIDLYTTNDYTEKDKLLLNQHGLFFKDAGDSLLTHISQFSMGVDIADFDNDGWLDIVTLDMLPESNARQKEFYWPDRYDVYATMVKNGLHHQYMRNMLQHNNGNGTFTEMGQLAGISNTDWSWAVLAADFDNDGLQDLFVSNGFKRNFTSNDFLRYEADKTLKAKRGFSTNELAEALNKVPSTKSHNYLFRNTGNNLFQDVSFDWGFNREALTNGAAYADLDNDGDLDLVTNQLDEPAGIYRNNQEKLMHNHFLRVKLVGNDKNTAGIGAQVTIFQQGAIQKKYVWPTRGFQSSVEPMLLFGLGKNETIDSLYVEWPRGEVQHIKHLKADQTIMLWQKNATAKNAIHVNKPVLFSRAEEVIKFKHTENDFIDFKVQSLLPRMYSTTGPALAAGDVNKDGLPDLYIGGAKNQAGVLFLQDKNNGYIQHKVFTEDAASEDVDAVFFDMDNDGDQDLYVVTGGYEFALNDKAMLDKLYRNDGKGNFNRVTLPEFYGSGSCVRPADIDSDGDLDLFVGGRITPGKYPQAPESYILVNDGHGKFSMATQDIAPALQSSGMITDACWSDLNKDNRPDLIVVGEWMPITIYINEQGKLADKSHDYIKGETAGWWNCIQAGDFDNDGDPDFAVGNFGMNNQFKPSLSRPMSLYYADFDSNGSIDPLMNYFIGDHSYPMPTRDELTDQLPSFKKRFPDYKSYTTATIETILKPEELAKSGKLTAYTLATCYLQNTGNELKLTPLPIETQVAPVFSFTVLDANEDGKPDLLALGNLSATRSRFGKAVGNFGVLLFGDGKGGFVKVPPSSSGLCVRGDARHAIWDGRRIVIGINNQRPEVYALRAMAK
ncbi:MAG TPA: VCBS repeat-containing protein [Ohtaekwangia sp.]|uniref:VCBS repeat-containing protein n=1 Tax=Ohtaekwangia sp. TaxID=2066019 RepID=UPI002F925A20